MSPKPELSILTPGKFSVYEVSEHGITFTDNISREQWLSVMQRLCGMVEGSEMAKQRALMMVADAANFGEKKFGEEFAAAISGMRQALGLTPKTIANAQWAYGKIEAARRKDGLTLGHYSVIAAIKEPSDQDGFIEQVVKDPKHTLTVQELKEEVATKFPKTKRGKPRKTTAVESSEDDADSITQKVIDVANWYAAGNPPTQKQKGPMETIYKAYRRKWASGRKRK